MTDTDNRPQLQAADAGSDVRLEEDTGPVPGYVHLSSGDAQRKRIIPERWSTWEAAKQHVRLSAARHAHRAAYHGVRSHVYFGKSAWYAAHGVYVTGRKIIDWWHIPGMSLLEHQAAADGLLNEHLRLHKQGRETRKARGIILAVTAVAVLVAVDVLVKAAPRWIWALLAAAAFAFLARAGRPEGKRIAAPAEIPAQVQPPTSDVIIRALGSIGVTEINKAITAGTFPPLPSPVREDGPGWRAEIDLPYGVTAGMVIDRREQLASGLRRPLGAVWPEPVSHEHAGRLELWVGRADISKAKPPAWPLARSGQADVFGELPFGVDVRGRVVKVPMAYHSHLIGSIPRQGKTAAVRLLACGAALDPLAELWIHELKGSGDLDPLERVSHRFASGVDDASIGYAAESLKLLKAEIGKRTERLKALSREVCPDKRTTRAIAARRALKLWPIVCVIDEAQNLFGHEKLGKQAGEDATWIIKIGPAFGVILLLATQRPDAKSLPTGVSSNVSQRFALKVMDQVANDMILGTSMYRNGVRATTFRAEIDAGLGYQVGAASQPKVVRTFYLNLPATEKIALRARALREATGTLSGVAAGEDDSTEPRDVLADVLEVFGGDSGLQWAELAARLERRFPDRWDGTAADAVSAELRARGVPSVDVKTAGQARKGCRRTDVETAAGA